MVSVGLNSSSRGLTCSQLLSRLLRRGSSFQPGTTVEENSDGFHLASHPKQRPGVCRHRKKRHRVQGNNRRPDFNAIDDPCWL